MLWFKQSRYPIEFRLIIAENVDNPHEYTVNALNENEAFESASNLARIICADTSRPVSAFLLDAHGVFLADLATPPLTSEMSA